MGRSKKGTERPVGFSKKALQKKEKRNLKRKGRGKKGSRND